MLTSLSVRHKGAVAVGVGLLVLFGVGSMRHLPLQLLPDINLPQITIYNNWRSAAPQEMEEAITQPLEEMLQFNAGLKASCPIPRGARARSP